jgi:Fe-S-cluster containining protein
MESLEAELDRARDLDIAALADAIESIGFECTRCGACCKAVEGCGDADGDPGNGHSGDGNSGDGDTSAGEAHDHVATVFPDEVRRLQRAAVGSESEDDGPATGGNDDGTDADAGEAGTEPYDWRDVARPMPYGLTEGPEGPEGDTFEWALQTDDCGDCRFYAEDAANAEAGESSETGEGGEAGGNDDAGPGRCTVHADRPLVCRTYPFSVALGGTSQPMGEAVDGEGMVRAHECEGLGRDISRADAEELAAALRERAVRELEEAVAVRDNYDPVATGAGEVVVHDSEGAKRPDGSPVER